MQLLFIILLWFISFYVTLAQCDQYVIYGGPKGYQHVGQISVSPGDQLIIDFSTESIPDRLILYFPDDTIDFNVGNGYQVGYSEFDYQDGILAKIIEEGQFVPSDYSVIYTPGNFKGCFRLNVIVPRICEIKYRVLGNQYSSTWFELCIRKFENENPLTDTTYLQICGKKENMYVTDSCFSTLLIYEDLSIQTEVNIQNPSCPKSKDGYVLFSSYPEFNEYSLGVGNYQIEISNGICKDTFDITLEPLEICDDYYIPNAFKDEFIFYSEQDMEYELSIYNRWGELIHQKIHDTNYNGWIPTRNIPFGVYVVKIIYDNKVYIRDVTYVK